MPRKIRLTPAEWTRQNFADFHDRCASTQRRLMACVIVLGACSYGASVLTVTAREKLWLGPQTFVLGAVGVCFAAAISAIAWQMRQAPIGMRVSHRTSRVALIGLVIASAILASLINRLAFHGFANSADEYAFLFQAKTFLHGRVWN